MKQIFILGTTEYAFMLHSMIQQENAFDIIGHTCSAINVERETLMCERHGVKIYPFEQLKQYKDEVNILCAIGYSNMNDTRMKLHNQCLKFGYKVVNFISNRAIVLSQIRGVGNLIFPGAYVGTNVEMGDSNIVYAGAVLTHDISIRDFNFIAANSTIGGVVRIGSNCFIGMGATIKNRIDISDYSLIGAGAYVSKSTLTGDVIVPARSVTLDKKSKDISLTN